MKSFVPNNIVSVSWSDHLIFGEGEGRLNTVAAFATTGFDDGYSFY